ncbi:LacI family DNA-binding transcriptional regulator [Dactylosporangium sp. CA-092794]|uniref:LacI family DNA-binding transcriptional regulator n=1 Tax=Dactylosporangium sp. CA-092794 TaxID=3239929 RepID=UPI003D8F29C2
MAEGDGSGGPATTIYDIARALGVSPSTVSRALHKPGRTSARTEERVRAAAEALGYRGNPAARALPTGRTGTLGLILSDITNPVWFDLIRGAERVTAAAGYTLVLAESQESAELELHTAERLVPSVDGFVLVASRLADEAIRRLAARRPSVVVNREVAGVECVVPDVAPGIRAALDHLAGDGHRSVAFLSGPGTSWMSRARWEIAFEEALRRGMSIVEIGPGAPTTEGGAAALRRLLACGATAALAYNDLMAIGLLRACQEGGVMVPGRLSVVGFDDIFGSDFTTPPITTIRTRLGPAGGDAVRRLIGLVERHPEPAAGPITTEFVPRGSTGPPAP